MRLSDLLNRVVMTESGERLGRLHDLRGEQVNGRLRITGLVAGEMGVLERYGVGIGGSPGPGHPKRHDHTVIAWDRVVRVAAAIIVRADP